MRLQRDESHGRSFSLEASFAWAPAAPQADCKQQLEQCVRGARGAVLVKEKLNPASKKEKQGTLSFKSSTQTPPCATVTGAAGVLSSCTVVRCR